MGLIQHGRSFPFQKLVFKRPGACTRWSLFSEFHFALQSPIFSNGGNYILFLRTCDLRAEARYI